VTRVIWLLIAFACAATACSRTTDSTATPPAATAPAPSSSSPAPLSQRSTSDGQPVEALVPPGWTIEQRHDGELNGDGQADAVLILRQGDESVPPRTVMVALGTGGSGRYAVGAQNALLIPADPNGQIEDPLADGGIDVRPQEFDLRLGLASASGSAQTAAIRYRFHWRDGCFQLVEFRRAETNRASLDIRDTTANLLTGDVTTKTGGEGRNDTRTTTSRIADRSRRCLADVSGGFDYDPAR